MPIKNITDKETLSSYGDSVSIRLFKGEPKSHNRAGADLKTCFRTEVTHPHIKRILSTAYGDRPEQLNVYLPYPDVDRVFPTNMELYSASGVMLRCDGETIYQRCQEAKDPVGGIRRQLIKTEDPCPMDNGYCPNKCQKSGRLYFLIKEVFEAGYYTKIGQLTVHSMSDILHLVRQLNRYQLDMTSLSSSPFPSPLTNGYIPFVLSRVEVPIKRPVLQNGVRTGKNTDGVTWVATLDIDPAWLSSWMQWNQVLRLNQLGFTPDPRTIQGIVGGLALPSAIPKTVEVQAVPDLSAEFAERIKRQCAERGLNSKEVLPLIEAVIDRPFTRWADIQTEQECFEIERKIIATLSDPEF